MGSEPLAAIPNINDVVSKDASLSSSVVLEGSSSIIADHLNNAYGYMGSNPDSTGAATMIKVQNPTLFSSWLGSTPLFNLYLDLPEWNQYIINGSFCAGNGGSANTSIVNFKMYVFPVAPHSGGTRVYIDDTNYSSMLLPIRIARKGSITRLFFGDLVARFGFSMTIDSILCRRSSLASIKSNGLKLKMNMDPIPTHGVEGWDVAEYPSGSVNYLAHQSWVNSNTPSKATLSSSSGALFYNGTSYSARSLNSTDVGISSNGTERVPLLISGSFQSNGIIVSPSNTAGSIPKRDSNGLIEIGTPTMSSSINSAVNLDLLQGVINNGLSAQESSSSLQALYPNVPIGFHVKTITNNKKYMKISATQWESVALNII